MSCRAELVIVGWQAIHGTLADPDIEAVALSPDLDLYPKAGYGSRNIDYEALMQ